MKTIFLFVAVYICPPSFADLDQNSQKALEQTQALLRSSSERQSYMKDHADAAAANDKVKALTGSPESQQAVYDLSAQIFETTTKRTDGDVKKQQELLKEAIRDPAAFIRSLPPEQQEALRNLATQIEKQNSSIAAPH